MIGYARHLMGLLKKAERPVMIRVEEVSLVSLLLLDNVSAPAVSKV